MIEINTSDIFIYILERNLMSTFLYLK